jgi:SPP1 family phage portal protein
MMGGAYITREDGKVVYSVYTNNMYYEIIDDKIVKSEGHIIGRVPIIEYPLNSARLGAFEIVIPLLDAINETISNRIDGIEQFIQALMILKGVDIASDDFKKLKELGGLKIPTDGDVKYLVQELSQSNTQTVVDDLYQSVLTICGMPNRNGGSSTSDTGSAVIMRDGWSDAEARAQGTEDMFKESEAETLGIVIYISNTFAGTNLLPSAVEPRFTRRNYENIQAKSQVLTTMLANPKIHPRLAFEYCGMFIDPELAYTESMAYNEEQQAKIEEVVTDESDNKDTDTE